MKKSLFLISFLLTFVAEIAALIIFAVHTPDFSQDAVAVNEVVQTVSRDFYFLDNHKNNTALDYVVTDCGGNILYRTSDGLSENINEAIAHRDTVLDIVLENAVVGKVIIYNDGAKSLQFQKSTVITVLSVAIAIEGGICAAYAVFMYVKVVKPFKKLKGFAERVAGGNLEIPLEMDRDNLFGAFTESFDIMRSELRKARIAEAQANESKKELVAKLSHDVKTPVASIKAVAEVGLAVSEKEKDRGSYTQIIGKADQINALITNLFTATLEELQQLTVTPVNLSGEKIKTLIENADYMQRASACDIPECLAVADPLRLQQVFDNIFANSYKYANTDITVTAQKSDGSLNISIEDFGGGVKEDELSVLKEKYKRGGNSVNTEGAGLGLYISDYFMKEMGGKLKIENGECGLKVTVALRLFKD